MMGRIVRVVYSYDEAEKESNERRKWCQESTIDGSINGCYIQYIQMICTIYTHVILCTSI